ncbi:MAG: hypothetical protein QOE70_5245 [Chthoniobacter sp.]|jgi:uncharacterized protein YbbC (DUF1343 family)/CubicO group peptidase (beta-lactamase class C family)|nr:hypothetical protein [Chthoniobacter sp.]
MFRPFVTLVVLVVSAVAQLQPEVFPEIDAAIRLAIADGRLPGGVVWVEHGGEHYEKAIGERAVEPVREPMTADTIFDAASLTKAVATTTCVMKLIEQNKVELDAPVARYLPEFVGENKYRVTVRQLLTHTSGTRPGIANNGIATYEEGIARACALPLGDPPGTLIRYSDVNFILLGEIVRRVSGQPLDEFAAAAVFRPLGMKDTTFRPGAEWRARIAPTTRDTARGVVHDPTASRMGGVAGHAGLFTTAGDLARFARMLLAGGELEGVRILKSETVRLMTSVQTPDAIAGRRGLGWDIDTGYSGPRGKWFPLGSYGHTGWTGASLWIDPFSQSFVVFMSNRNHPTEAGNVLPLRQILGTLAAESVRGFNFARVPGALAPRPGGPLATARATPTAEVLTGLDVLVRENFAPLRGLRVGLITNHTGIDRQRRRNIDLLAKADGVKLVALFSPEHGIAGKADGKVADTRDAATGLPVYSLYGEGRAPKPEHLAGLDALVFDIQDIGCRFYTYSSTLGEGLAAAAKAGLKYFVLDRPNPIGGVLIDGPVRDGEASFTAWHDVPVRHGLTLGELAQLYNTERGLGADLTFIPCEGWTRDLWWDQTGLPWVNPSPNMRSLTAATLYPGVGLVEFCSVSVGRGTDRPFELVGAPYIDDRAFAAALNAEQLPGVRFIPTRFTPASSVFAGQDCGGVQILITDRDSLNPWMSASPLPAPSSASIRRSGRANSSRSCSSIPPPKPPCASCARSAR